MIVSETRLRLRSWRRVADFARHAAASLGQVVRANGLVDGRLLAGRRTQRYTTHVGGIMQATALQSLPQALQPPLSVELRCEQ